MVCDKVVFVCDRRVAGGRRGGGGGGVGYRIKKQEPQTKMWGKTK